MERYLGVVNEDSGETQEDAYPRANSLVVFKWSFNVDGDMTVCEIRAHAGNVKKRGVPTPKALPDALLHKRMLRASFSVVRNKVTGVSSPLWLSSPDKNLPNLELVEDTGRYPAVLPDPSGAVVARS